MKVRADQLLVKQGLASSRQKAQALILAGSVYVAGRRIEKAGQSLEATSDLEVRKRFPFVSRGGIKLEHALSTFEISVTDKVALDVGASTGGFTDCLLQRGARKVYALDVGHGQLDASLRDRAEVVVLERVNIRYWKGEDLAEPVELITVDVAFISLKKVIPVLEVLLQEKGAPTVTLIFLIKPQFEAERSEVRSGGVVRDEAVCERILKEIQTEVLQQGWEVVGVTPAPIKGPKGNQESLLIVHRRAANTLSLRNET